MSIKYRLWLVSAALMLGSSANMWAAGDGAALYKKKCSVCHGANGEGKAAIKAPALKGTAMDVDQITDHITKGEPSSRAPHNKAIAGLDENQARAIAEHVKTLK